MYRPIIILAAWLDWSAGAGALLGSREGRGKRRLFLSLFDGDRLV